MYIIFGLGNPGIPYQRTRHNVGFMTIDILAEKLNINVSKKKFKALIGEGAINGEKVVLVKPQTYMNLSGESIIEVMKWYKTDLSGLIIVYDDIDIDIGKIRIRTKGGPGTHNGMRSVVDYIDSEEFPRVRIGIGKPPVKDYELADYVLSKFYGDDEKNIQEALQTASEAVLTIIKDGIDTAMNKYNA